MQEHRPELEWKFGGDIVAGERIGNFVLGRRAADLVKNANIAEYAMRYEVRVELEGDLLVEASTSSPRFATPEGFKVGGDFSEVENAYGPPPERMALEGSEIFKAAYPDRGIDFLVQDGKVAHVGVFQEIVVEFLTSTADHTR
ncbi:MAG: hypothetical protein FJX76_12790 [Armatimonadetes bacterium]|nr:hypothetical protein [Armatimonadota bacterium]